MREVLETKARMLEDRINMYARLLGQRVSDRKKAEYFAMIESLEIELSETLKQAGRHEVNHDQEEATFRSYSTW